MPSNKNISPDIRNRIISSYENGNVSSDIASTFCCSIRSVQRIIKAYKEENRRTAKPVGGNRLKKINLNGQTTIKSTIQNNCCSSLKELKNELFTINEIECSVTTVHRELKNFNYSLKRVINLPARRNTPSQIEQRKNYAMEFYNMTLQQDGRNIIFIDELGFNASMRCKRGYAPSGKAPIQKVRQIKSRNISICCAMSREGTYHYAKSNKAFNKETFLGFIDAIIEKIEEDGAGPKIFIFDNVAFHKSPEVAETLEASGHTVRRLPPYSPFLNPIEAMFSQWKSNVRSRTPRDEEHLFNLIDEVFRMISNQNCENYYLHMMRFLPACINEEPIEDETDVYENNDG